MATSNSSAELVSIVVTSTKTFLANTKVLAPDNNERNFPKTK